MNHTETSPGDAEASLLSVVTEPEGKNRITPERVLEELSVAFGTEIIPTVVTCLRFLIGRNDRFMHPLKNLMQFIQVINIVFKLRLDFTSRSLNIYLHDEPCLTVGVDLTLTTITCIVDHLFSARVESVPQRDWEQIQSE
ncbi:MAG: hypothetical protein CBD74_10125 [Saprospirales bacterium TMED214]|nr:MAG: hypothetical protein CBD74_10125 [Saprospirales bacterium TMED214]